jgi:phage anti-repressor protein
VKDKIFDSRNFIFCKVDSLSKSTLPQRDFWVGIDITLDLALEVRRWALTHHSRRVIIKRTKECDKPDKNDVIELLRFSHGDLVL